jgi:hypothetical protein
MGRKVSDFESNRMKQYYQACALKYLNENDSLHQAGREASIKTQEEFDRPRKTVAEHTKDFRSDGCFDTTRVTIDDSIDNIEKIISRGYDEENDPAISNNNNSSSSDSSNSDFELRVEEANDDFESDWLLDKRHEIVDGKHRFYLTQTVTPVVIGKEKLQNMKEDYSKMLSDGLKMENIANKYDIPEPWFKEIKLIMDWTHDDDIFTDEQYIEKDVDTLRDIAIRKFKQRLKEGHQKDRWEIVEENHQKWVNFEQTVFNDFVNRLDELDDKRTIPRLDGATFPSTNHEYSVVLSPFDMHYGMYASKSESGDKFDRDVARNRLVEKTEQLLSNICVNGKPDKFYVGIGSDFFHIDTDKGTTSSQKVAPQIDGTPGEILAEGSQLMTTYIDMLSQIANVEIIPVPGNHDMHSTISLLLYIDAYYKDSNKVRVEGITENDGIDIRPRQYRRYGNNLIGFTHGCDEKRGDLSSLMSHEAKEDWGDTEHKLFMTGHKHHEIIKDDDGVLIYQLPSLTGHDRYHYRKGLNRSRRALSACLFDKDDGVFSTMYAPLTI